MICLIVLLIPLVAVVIVIFATAHAMAIELFDHQEVAFDLLKPGSILCGGVGSGKSRTGLAYYFVNECGGEIEINGKGEYSPMKNPKDLYIITTAKKRDSCEWDDECSHFLLSTNSDVTTPGTRVVIDSWNNITKYTDVENAFFIFDEQRIVGAGVWVKSFLKIAKKNSWILLSATPGDTWMDYVPVFIANGFYKNRTEFMRRHVVFNTRVNFPKIDHYVEVGRLERLKRSILVNMEYTRPSTIFNVPVAVSFDEDIFKKVFKERWNVFENKPIKNVSEFCYLMRKVVNTDSSRAEFIRNLIEKHKKIIIFYNFNYELDILKELSNEMGIKAGEWNGHKHEAIPESDSWLYLVQYTAGAEGWNCIETNCIVFYSQNYSYRIMIQAAGRIDRLNTTYPDLYYYHLKSNAYIDLMIAKALKEKKNFNELSLSFVA